MKKLLVVALLFVSVVLFANGVLVVNTISQTLSDVYDLQNGGVNPNVCSLGEVSNSAPNKMAFYSNYVYVVITYENALQKIDLFSKEERSMIYFENGALPNDVVIDTQNHFAYVSGNGTGKVYKVDLSNDSVIGSVSVGQAPQGMEIADGKLFVANTGFNVNDYTYQAGTVSVIDLETFSNIHTIETDINPTGIKKIGSNIFVVCTGNYVDVLGNVDVYNYSTYESVTQISFETSIGGIAYDEASGRFFIGSPMGSGVFVCSAADYSIIHNANEGLFAGGSALCVAEQYLVVADPNNWTENSHIRAYSLNDYSLVSDVETGVGAVDVKAYQGQVDNDNSLIGINELSNCYPNPFIISKAKTNIRIKFYNGSNNETNYQIFNLKGQLVYQDRAFNTDTISWNAKDLNGNPVTNGVYYFKINYKNKEIIRKVSVIKLVKKN
jgi:hypothetical protein